MSGYMHWLACPTCSWVDTPAKGTSPKCPYCESTMAYQCGTSKEWTDVLLHALKATFDQEKEAFEGGPELVKGVVTVDYTWSDGKVTQALFETNLGIEVVVSQVEGVEGVFDVEIGFRGKLVE